MSHPLENTFEAMYYNQKEKIATLEAYIRDNKVDPDQTLRIKLLEKDIAVLEARVKELTQCTCTSVEEDPQGNICCNCYVRILEDVMKKRADEIATLTALVDEMGEAMREYANWKNWSNGGFEGERSTIWRGPSLSGPNIAEKALTKYQAWKESR